MPLALLSALCHSPARLPLPGSRRAGTRRVTTSRRAANARAVVLIRVRTGDSTCWPSTDYTYHTNQHAVHLGVVLASCFRPPRTRYVPPVSLSSSLCTSPPVAASPAHFTRESLARASQASGSMSKDCAPSFTTRQGRRLRPTATPQAARREPCPPSLLLLAHQPKQYASSCPAPTPRELFASLLVTARQRGPVVGWLEGFDRRDRGCRSRPRRPHSSHRVGHCHRFRGAANRGLHSSHTPGT